MATLQNALTTGRTKISGTYNNYYNAMGEQFAIGDAIAVDQLKDYKILVLEQIILNMRGDQMTMNYPQFSYTAETTQQKAIDCLSTLRQRLLVAAPVQQALPWQRQSSDTSRYTTGRVTELGEIQPDERLTSSMDRPRSIEEQDERRDSSAPSEVASSFDHQELLVNPWEGENVPLPRKFVAASPKSVLSGRRHSAGPSRPPTGGFDPYPKSPLTPQDSNEDIPSPLVPLSSTPISITSSTTATSPPPRGHRPSFSDRIKGRIGSSFSLPTRTNTSQDSLPSESNNFLGLCKSAWRLQVGADESALQIGKTLVGGSLSQYKKHWVCKSSNCRYDGMIIQNDLDRRKIQFSDQLIFKWTFLFKCHLPAKTADVKAYGCVFCASPIGPTIGALPVFEAIERFSYISKISTSAMASGQQDT